MTTDQPTSPDIPPNTTPRPSETAMGVSQMLSAVAIWLVLWGFWIQYSTYQQYQGRTDLDMPEWFNINMGVILKVLPLAGLAGLLNLVAAAVFLEWIGRARWAVRIGFALQWLASLTLVGLLVWSLRP